MEYELRETLPTPETFVSLRKAAGMAPRSHEAAERGLAGTLFGAIVVETETDTTVGMGRVIGDGGCVYHISDMAVHPDHQENGLGTQIMDALMNYIESDAPESAYVNLVADVDGFYEQWGFTSVAPESKGMHLRL